MYACAYRYMYIYVCVYTYVYVYNICVYKCTIMQICI